MSGQIIQSDLFVEISTEQQQLLSGGQRRCPERFFYSRRCGWYVPEEVEYELTPGGGGGTSNDNTQ